MSLPEVRPVLAVLAREVPQGREWRYEVKLDGFRGTLYIEKGGALFRSKTGRIMRRFQSLADELAKKMNVPSAIFDGEIIAVQNSSVDFKALMRARTRPQFVAFDLLWLDGVDLRQLRYLDRKRRLGALLRRQKGIGYVDAYDDPSLFERARQLDLEGIVAKRTYDSYDASALWLKIKHGGYTQMEGRHELFG